MRLKTGSSPAFDVDVMVEAIAAAADARWDEWRRIQAPTLIVRGERGDLSEEEAAEMASALPDRRARHDSRAGHDVHLDEPEAWRAAVESFLARLS